MLGFTQVFELMQTQVAQGDGVRQTFLHLFINRLAENDLLGMHDPLNAGGPIDLVTIVVVIAFLGRSGMQPHPHPNGCLSRPGFGNEGTLCGEGSVQGVVCRRKDGHEGIADGLDDKAVVLLDA